MLLNLLSKIFDKIYYYCKNWATDVLGGKYITLFCLISINFQSDQLFFSGHLNGLLPVMVTSLLMLIQFQNYQVIRIQWIILIGKHTILQIVWNFSNINFLFILMHFFFFELIVTRASDNILADFLPSTMVFRSQTWLQ